MHALVEKLIREGVIGDLREGRRPSVMPDYQRAAVERVAALLTGR
jgi:hypothetical protein